MDETIILPRRVAPQPSPAIVPGGDCGACVLAGLFGITVADAYAMQDPDERPADAKDAPIPFSWHNMVHTVTWR